MRLTDFVVGVNSVYAADVNDDGAVDAVLALSSGRIDWLENPGSTSSTGEIRTSKKKSTKTDYVIVIVLAVILAVVLVACCVLAFALYAKRKNEDADGNTFHYKRTKNTLTAEIKDDDSVTTASDISQVEAGQI